MQTYTTMRGETIDLSGLTTEERAHLDRCISEWRNGEQFEEFYYNLVGGTENPLVGPSRVIRRDVMDHPLWKALHDIEARVGIAQGRFSASPEDDIRSDPLADEFMTIAEAARQKQVTRAAVYNAITRGDLVTVGPAHRRMISKRSMSRWTVNRERQQSGRKAHGIVHDSTAHG